MAAYGLGQGIAQGLQMAQAGMLQAEDIKQNRRKIQMQEAQFAQQMQQGQLSMQQSEQQIQALKMQIEQMQKENAKKDTFSAFDSFERTGDTKFLNLMKKNPLLKQQLDGMGTAGFLNTKDLTPEKLSELGVTEEMLNDPAKRIVIATSPNGKMAPINLMEYYAATGYIDKMDADKLKAIELKQKEIAQKTETLKFEDMEKFLEKHPNATLADYLRATKETKTAVEQTAEYIGSTLGEEGKTQYLKKTAGMLEKEPSAITVDKYKTAQINAINEEAGVSNLYDVDVNKLKGINKTNMMRMAKEEADKTDIREEVKAMASLDTAAKKLDVDTLSKSTGIVDATVKEAMDTLGMDLDDDVLKNSSNYNLIVNSFIKASMGSQVTGNELDRVKKQLGTEFKADNTVKIKLAETLENAANSYSSYKTIAPALYATEIRGRVNSLLEVANYLRTEAKAEKTKSTKLETKEWEGVTYYKDLESNRWLPLKEGK